MIHNEVSQEEFDNLTKDAARYRFMPVPGSRLLLEVIRWEDDEGSPIAGNWMDFTIDRQMEDKDAIQ